MLSRTPLRRKLRTVGGMGVEGRWPQAAGAPACRWHPVGRLAALRPSTPQPEDARANFKKQTISVQICGATPRCSAPAGPTCPEMMRRAPPVVAGSSGTSAEAKASQHFRRAANRRKSTPAEIYDFPDLIEFTSSTYYLVLNSTAVRLDMLSQS